MCVDRNVEQQCVRDLAEARDRGHEHAAEQSDDDGDQHEASLAIAHEIAQEQRQQADAGRTGQLRRMRCRHHNYAGSRNGSVRTTRKPILLDEELGVLELRAATR
ncbi:hypothetical protein ACVWZW_005953 [Bradyrhizobium sp. F1.13.4]